MVEFLREYWWAGMVLAAVIVVATHTGLVKLIAHLERKPADKPEQH